jgi:hypothetical protein
MVIAHLGLIQKRFMKISKQMDADLETAANETNSVYLAEPLRANWEKKCRFSRLRAFFCQGLPQTR